MNRFRTVLAAASLLALTIAPALAAPEVYSIDQNHSQIGFTIRHFVSRVPGHFGAFSGEITVDKDDPKASKVSAEIETKSIDTATAKRDDHLRSADFFDAEKFPKINFVSKSVTSTGKDKTKLLGDLTMHGVTKPVSLDVTWLGFSGPKAGFEARTTVNRKDFGIVWNKALDAGALMLGDEVDITLLVEANNVEMMKKMQGPPKPPATPPKTDK